MLIPSPTVGFFFFTANVAKITNKLFSLFPQIELLTLLFVNSLAEEAKAKAFEERSSMIRAQHLRAVSKVSLTLSPKMTRIV